MNNNKIRIALNRICSDLDDLQYRYALVGGFALAAHGHARATQDIDLAIAVGSDSETESLVYALLGRGYQQCSILEHKTQRCLATARLWSPSQQIIVDLLFASCGIESEVVNSSETLQVLGSDVRVASRTALIAMKVLSVGEFRPHDKVDLLALLKGLSEEQFEQVYSYLSLMDERGFSRGKDLKRTLEKMQSLAAYENPHFRKRKLKNPTEG